MNLRLSHCFLAVDDHAAALTFDRDVLGFEVKNDVSKGDMRWITLSPPSQQDIEIVLRAAGAEVIQEPIDRPWGPKDCAFRDPAGNVLRFNQMG